MEVELFDFLVQVRFLHSEHGDSNLFLSSLLSLSSSSSSSLSTQQKLFFLSSTNANRRVLLEVKSASLIKKLAANKQQKTYERLKEKQAAGAAEPYKHKHTPQICVYVSLPGTN